MNVLVKYYMLPLAIMQISHILMLKSFPNLQKYSDQVSVYMQNNVLGTINGISYMEVFPPLFIIMVIFFVFLFNKRLSN
jgi:hypothetical protein